MPPQFEDHGPHATNENDDSPFDIYKPIGIIRQENKHGQVIHEREIFLEDEFVFGREPNTSLEARLGRGETYSWIITDDATQPVVSKTHFRIYSILFEKGVQPLIYCEDLESTNGTFVNGVCIGTINRDRIGHLLCHDDVIEVRPYWRFRLHQPSQCPMSEFRGHPEDIEYFKDRYDITDRLLGSGMHGAVFLATEIATSKQTACKIVRFCPPEASIDDTDRQELPAAERAKIMREITILSKINHPHIVNLRKAFCSDTTMYTFTDLAPGGDLFSYITSSGGPLTDCHTRIITRQLVLAINYLHSNGIVHRDIKPENVLIMRTSLGGRVVLTDFGFATEVRLSQGRMKSKLGTPGYAAPEVELVEYSGAAYTSAIDLWSLGKVVAYMLTSDLVLPPHDLSQLNDQQKLQVFDVFEDPHTRDMLQGLSQRALKFLQRLLVIDAKDRMNAEEALRHSWLTRPVSEAREIEECCAKIIRFWEKRDGDEIVSEPLPQLSQNQQDESSPQDSRSKRKLPDASSSPYFSLERHLTRRQASQRRTMLQKLNKSGSHFVTTGQDSNTSRLRVTSSRGNDIFGRSPATQTAEELANEDELSLVPTTPSGPRIQKRTGSAQRLNTSDPISSPLDYSPKSDQTSATLDSGSQNTSRKRVRWQSEDPEERNLRDEVAKSGPKWQSAKDLGIAMMKKKMEVSQRGGKTGPAHSSLSIRTSSRSG